MPESANKNRQTPSVEESAAEQPVAIKSAAPQGVIQPAAKMYVLLGIAVVILLATAISSLHKQEAKPKPATTPVVLQQPDTSQITDFQKMLKQQIDEQQQQKLPDKSTASPAQFANGGTTMQQPYDPAVGNGTDSSTGNAQPDAEEQQREALAAQEREMSFKSRFASNLAFSASHADPCRVAADRQSTNRRAYL